MNKSCTQKTFSTTPPLNKQIFKTHAVALFSAYINHSWQCFQIGVWLLKENVLRPKVNCLMSKMSDEVMEEIDRVSHREGVHAL